MTRITHFLSRISAGIAGTCTVASIAFFALMLLTVTGQIVARYVLSSPPFWTEELARWCMVWGGLTGAVVAFSHAADPILYMPPQQVRAFRLLNGAARLVTAWAFMGTVLYFAYPYLERQVQQTSIGLGISQVWLSVSVPICAALICIDALLQFIVKAFGPAPEPTHATTAITD